MTARTVAGIDLTTVLGVVLAFILLDIIGTALLVIFSAGAGKRSSQSGLFNWGLPDFSGVYSSVSQMYNRLESPVSPTLLILITNTVTLD